MTGLSIRQNWARVSRRSSSTYLLRKLTPWRLFRLSGTHIRTLKGHPWNIESRFARSVYPPCHRDDPTYEKTPFGHHPPPPQKSRIARCGRGLVDRLPIVRAELFHFFELLSPFSTERRQLDELSKIECAAIHGRRNWPRVRYEG
jgi:hypothetical protein